MRRLLLALLFFYSISAAFAQQTEQQLVLVLPDTALTKPENLYLTFDSAGNYCYYISQYPGMVVTNMQTYGPFTSQDDKYSTTIFYNTKGRNQYIKVRKSTKVYGPIDGKIDMITSSNRKYFAYAVQGNDSTRYYINGILVATSDTGSYTSRGWWCTFSDNGNALYAIKKGRHSYLFLNNKLIDSSEYEHNRLKVDNENCYRYSLGTQESASCGSCTYNKFKPLKHTSQKVFGPVAARESVFRKYDGSVYYYGNGNGAAYTIENDSLYKHMTSFIAPGKSKNFLIYKENYAGLGQIIDSVTKMNVNGNEMQLPYSQIFSPCIDSAGNYALFGLRNYYLYRYINGVEQKQPLSKYGVRANPISIDTKGNTICYYLTDDSVYTYENDRLFGKCGVRKFYLLHPGQVMFDYSFDIYNDLSAFCIDSACYIVYKNTISSAIPKPTYYHDGDTFRIGDVIYGYASENSYWMLQKAGYGKYNLIINNRSVILPPNVNFESPIWFQLAENFVFTGKAFIFYTQKGTNIYRHKITL